MAAPISKAALDAVAERHAGSARPDLVAIATGRFDVEPGEQWRASFDGVGDVAIRAG
jgi:hypothetical protein